MSSHSNLGAVIADVEGTSVKAHEQSLLKDPNLGGIILFARNFSSCQQLVDLCNQIRDIAGRDLLIAVDQEGGRVQRFKDGFTVLPAPSTYGSDFDQHPKQGLHRCYEYAKTMAAELRACGVDLSFAPVLDVDYGANQVIGNRAFHHDPSCLTELASAWIDGMHHAGMAAVGKHFPGHGFVSADSHTELPVDPRSLSELEAGDLKPFRSLASACEGVMTAHIRYPKIDSELPTYSTYWLKEQLRDELNFKGVIFSDDLTMCGALGAGGPAQRAQKALSAGCDCVLICNDGAAARVVLEQTNFDDSSGKRVGLEYVKKARIN